MCWALNLKKQPLLKVCSVVFQIHFNFLKKKKKKKASSKVGPDPLLWTSVPARPGL